MRMVETIELARLYTISEVAALLGVSDMTVLRRVKEGWIPAQRANTTWLIAGNDLKNTLEATKQIPIIKTNKVFIYI